MTNFDFSPLYRSAIGFDRLFNQLDNASRNESDGGYPPYNIESVDENQYRITMAVAGFSEDELEITSEQNKLVVSGKKQPSENNTEYLHRGIAQRSFERRFQLADHVEVTGANLEHGLLHIALKRELPEAMKPRTISINGGNGKLLEGKDIKAA